MAGDLAQWIWWLLLALIILALGVAVATAVLARRKPVVAAPLPTNPPAAAVRRVPLLGATQVAGTSGLTVDRGRTAHFFLYGGSQVGLQHSAYGNTREDSYALGGSSDGRGSAFLAVADGLGASRNAHAAAHIAARDAMRALDAATIADRISNEAWTDASAEIMATVAGALAPANVDALADQLGYRSVAPPDDAKSATDPACALAIAAVSPLDADHFHVAWAAVGDCDVLLVDVRERAIDWLTSNDSKTGPRITNATASLPSSPDRLVHATRSVPMTTVVALASDGMADRIRVDGRGFVEAIANIVDSRPLEPSFAELVSFTGKGLHDDRTLVIAWPAI